MLGLGGQGLFVKVCAGGAGVRQMLSHDGNTKGCPSYRLLATGGSRENVDWHLLFQGYKAAVDWPSCNYWREQLRAFPEAKIILTKRDPDSWYESVMNTIWPASVKGGSWRDRT